MIPPTPPPVGRGDSGQRGDRAVLQVQPLSPSGTDPLGLDSKTGWFKSTGSLMEHCASQSGMQTEQRGQQGSPGSIERPPPIGCLVPLPGYHLGSRAEGFPR